MSNTSLTSSDTQAPVKLERLPGHVALVTLNRPEARNAINAGSNSLAQQGTKLRPA